MTIKLNFSLSPNPTYRVKITKNTAKDKEGNSLSSFSTIDTIPPKFEIVYKRPVAALGEFLAIVRASEPLSDIPYLDVRDSSSTPGIATVSVKGKDLSGNVGTEIISGGSFVIDNWETVELLGTADPSASVVANLDGVRIGETKADERGAFVIKMDLPKEGGEYRIMVESPDLFGNMARPISRRIKVGRNSYPEIASPRSGFVTSEDSVSVEGSFRTGLRDPCGARRDPYHGA